MSDNHYDLLIGVLACGPAIMLGICGVGILRGRQQRVHRWLAASAVISAVLVVLNGIMGQWGGVIAWSVITTVFTSLAIKWYRWTRDRQARSVAETFWDQVKDRDT